MKPRELKVGEIVQLSPEVCRNPMFGGCMLVVTEPKSFGCQGYVQALGADGKIGGQAFYRPSWEEIEPTGGMSQWELSMTTPPIEPSQAIGSSELLALVERAIDNLSEGVNGQQYDPSWIRPRSMTRKEISDACEQAYHVMHLVKQRLKANAEADEYQLRVALKRAEQAKADRIEAGKESAK